jgi:hypothetical protein
MTVEEEDDGWRSLSQREVSTQEDALFEGAPEHLVPSLSRWITGYLHNRPELTQRVALRLRVPLDTPDPQQLVEAVRASDSARLLDVADMAIHLDQSLRWDLDVLGPEMSPEAGWAAWIPDHQWSKGSSAEAVEQLDQLLEDAGSAHRVDWGQRCLKRRVDATVTVAAEHTMAAAPGRHLQEAWAAVYGRHLDPAKAYDEAVRGVEAAAIPVLLPKGAKETLGKVLAHLRDAGGKWALAIEGADDGDVAPLTAMIQLLWNGHVARHAGGPSYRPQRQDEAEMAVHLATTLVQWFTSGAVRRRKTDTG